MISIITPSHNTKHLFKVYSYLKQQTNENWEWIILLNNGAEPIETSDARVKQYVSILNSTFVGMLKKEACSHAKGDIILELDHDDFLLPTALEMCQATFDQNPDAVFVYSNSLPLNSDGTIIEYRRDFGWEYGIITFEGKEYPFPITPVPVPQHISKIWFAPDHFRSWRKDVYDRIGGHNENLSVCDDHELICRLYLEGDFIYIPSCLYIYNVHGENTWLKRAEDIQKLMMNNYFNYLEPMMKVWCKDNGYGIFDLCGAIDTPKGYKSIDRQNADINCDLNEDWPIGDDQVGLLRANDAIEHLKNPIHTMNEAYRVLTHGGMFIIDVPSTDGKGAFCDPTHVSFWNDRSFRYYTEGNMRRYLEPECKCKFQISYQANIMKYDNLPYVRIHLIAIKEGQRIMGELKF